MPLVFISVVVVVIIIAVASILIALNNGNGSGGNGGKVVTMSAQELDDDMETEYRENHDEYDLYVKQNFKSLNAGDIVRLEDVITDIDRWGDETEIELGHGQYFEFSGDLTDELEEGDIIVITLHVIRDSGTITEDGERIYFDIETFEEVWDIESNEEWDDPLPSSIIINTGRTGSTDDGYHDSSEYTVEIVPLDAKDAEQDVDVVMFYLKHTGGEPLDLRDYMLVVGPEGSECSVSLMTDVRSMPGHYNSTWDNVTKTLSVNNRVYISPGCLGTDIDSGDRINLILVNKDTDKLVWEKQITVYDS